MGVRLKQATLYAVDIPFRQRFRTNLIEKSAAANVLLRLEAESGMIGWGEGNPHPVITGETQQGCFASLKEMLQSLQGQQEISADEVRGRFHGQRGSGPTAVMLLEMAMLDIEARQQGVTLADLFGQSHSEPLETDITLSLESPELMQVTAAAHKRSGFRAFKMKVGAEGDVERIAAVREAIGREALLKIDANQAWDFPQALAVLQRLEPYDIALCEQPVAKADWAALQRLAEQQSVAIMADEALTDLESAKVLAAECPDCHFNIKASKSAGLLEAARIADFAQQAGIHCQLGCMTEGAIAMTAFAQLAATRKFRWLDLDGAALLEKGPIDGGLQYRNGGRMELPEGPGIGAVGQSSALQHASSWSVRY